MWTGTGRGRMGKEDRKAPGWESSVYFLGMGVASTVSSSSKHMAALGRPIFKKNTKIVYT